MLQGTDLPVIWRGPRKTNLIKRFLKDTYWGKLDYLIIDTPPGKKHHSHTYRTQEPQMNTYPL